MPATTTKIRNALVQVLKLPVLKTDSIKPAQSAINKRKNT